MQIDGRRTPFETVTLTTLGTDPKVLLNMLESASNDALAKVRLVFLFKFVSEMEIVVFEGYLDRNILRNFNGLTLSYFFISRYPLFNSAMSLYYIFIFR